MLTERAGSTPGPAVLTTPSKGKEAMVTYLEASLKTANDRVRVACCTSLLLLPPSLLTHVHLAGGDVVVVVAAAAGPSVSALCKAVQGRVLAVNSPDPLSYQIAALEAEAATMTASSIVAELRAKLDATVTQLEVKTKEAAKASRAA
jgi:hypothetical protein